MIIMIIIIVLVLLFILGVEFWGETFCLGLCIMVLSGVWVWDLIYEARSEEICKNFYWATYIWDNECRDWDVILPIFPLKDN